MKIDSITKYVFEGKEYTSLKDIQEEIHNTIGVEVLDKIAKTCPLQKHKDYQTLLDLICSKNVRDILVKCLTVEYDYIIEENWQGDEIEATNILDI